MSVAIEQLYSYRKKAAQNLAFTVDLLKKILLPDLQKYNETT